MSLLSDTKDPPYGATRNIVTFLLIVGVLTGCTRCDKKSINVDKAKGFIKAEMYDNAIPLLEKEIKEINPENAEAHYLLGLAYLKTGQEHRAAKRFDSAIALEPEEYRKEKYTREVAEFYCEAGLNFLNKDMPGDEDIRRGLGLFDKAINRDETLKLKIVESCRDKGIKLSEFDKSLSRKVLDRALKLNPNLEKDEDFYYTQYIVNAEDSKQKNEACDNFISYFPESKHIEQVRYLLGYQYYQKKNYKKAKAYFSEVKGDPKLVKKVQKMLANIREIEEASEGADVKKAEKQKIREQKRQERQLRDFENITNLATITASSEYSSQYSAANVGDGIIAEHNAGEWASRGEKAGAWIKLTWPDPDGIGMEVNKVVLYDRPNPTDRIFEATIWFSDGSQLKTGHLPNDGSPLVLEFVPKEITSLKFTVVSGRGKNLGLSEIEVFGR